MSGSRLRMKNVVLDMTKLPEEEQQKYAMEFSEGSPELRDTLLYIWQNGINSYACCAGHDQERFGNAIAYNDPYIMFDIDSLTPKELKDLMTKLIVANETSETPFLRFDVTTQLLYSEQFMKTVAEGTVLGDVFERHSMKINFTDHDNTHYKDLLKILQSVKTRDKSIVTQLRDKFKQGHKIGTQFKDFINSALELNECSLQDGQYLDIIPFKSINAISLAYEKDQLTQNVGTERPAGYRYFQEGLVVGEVAEGYVSKILDINRYVYKYFTIKNDEIVEIDVDEAQKLTPYQIDKSVEFDGDFDKEKMEVLLGSIGKKLTSSYKV